MRTYSMKASEIQKDWILIDAEDLVVGRVASLIAKILRGKHKATYTPHMDCGDYVVVINADKIKFTGKKYTDKRYYRHTGYPGGLKVTNPKEIMTGRFPERVLYKAVERMLPRGPLFRDILVHLRIYSGNTHPHEAQQPKLLDVKSMNRKNSRAA
ncbi:MAG: 50S ribosomal protein L13 [Pseudomonadota bacterium]